MEPKETYDNLMVTYAYPDNDNDKWAEYSEGIRNYLRATFKRFKIRMSEKESHLPGVVVAAIVDDLSMPFDQIKMLLAGIPIDCKKEGLKIIVVYKGIGYTNFINWIHEF